MFDGTLPHEPQAECGPDHCWSCNVDEDARGAYIVCTECGHVYRTARALRRTYRRIHRDIGSQQGPRPWLSDGWQTGRWRWWRTLLTLRASKIYYCPVCAHDF